MSNIFSLIPGALLIAAAIIVPAMSIACQELSIEGPFGWSSLTFTERYSTKSLVSKIFQLIFGRDKWATDYHLASIIVWSSLYFNAFAFIAYYSRSTGNIDVKILLGTIVLAVVCVPSLMLAGDYIWFLISPYYGPERLAAEYVPWHKEFKFGVPRGYWLGMAGTVLVTTAASLCLGNYSIVIIWLMTMLIVIAYCTGLRWWVKRIKGLKLAKYWWKNITFVVIERYPYPVEGDKNKQSRKYVISADVMEKLIKSGEATSLEESLSKVSTS